QENQPNRNGDLCDCGVSYGATCTVGGAELVTYEGHGAALSAAKQKINSEFRKNLAESSPEKITQLLKLGSDVEVVLRTSVIQGVHIDHNKILLRPTKEVLQDNAPFHDTPRKDT
uniref:Uncharacterized protein n=1 Tax=Callorhinchus milii TaxID=7868 RepID=A0A4W3H4F6_CALMI